MRIQTVLLLSALILTGCSEKAEVPWDPPGLYMNGANLGGFRMGRTLETSVELENTFAAAIPIEKIETSCGCTRYLGEGFTIEPRERRTLALSVEPKTTGEFEQSLTLFLRSGETRKFGITGTVIPEKGVHRSIEKEEDGSVLVSLQGLKAELGEADLRIHRGTAEIVRERVETSALASGEDAMSATWRVNPGNDNGEFLMLAIDLSSGRSIIPLILPEPKLLEGFPKVITLNEGELKRLPSRVVTVMSEESLEWRVEGGKEKAVEVNPIKRGEGWQQFEVKFSESAATLGKRELRVIFDSQSTQGKFIVTALVHEG